MHSLRLQSLPTKNDVALELARRSLAEFVVQAWPIVEPDTKMLWNWHLDLLCEYLECITFGDIPHVDWLEANDHEGPIRQLIVNEPPGYMKSYIITVMWPCWEWIHTPGLRHICSSYSAGLSTRHSLFRRNIVQSEWYMEAMRRSWGHPDFGMVGDQNLKTQFTNIHKGNMFSTSTGGTVQGTHGDRIIMDDPVNPEEAISEAHREKAKRFFDLTLSQRVRDKENPIYVLVMQRLHEDDLTGHLLEQGGWVHICLPCPAVSDERYVFPRSGRVHEVKEGEALWPEREGLDAIANARVHLGEWAFAGQYLQSPSPLEGGVLKRAWWKRGTPPAEFDTVLQSWDMAFKGNVGSDFVAGLVIGAKGSQRWVLDCVNARMDFSRSCDSLQDVSAKWPQAIAKLVEDKANGPAIINALESKVTGLIPRNPEGGKIARVMSVQPEVEAGNWWIPHDAPWAADFIEQAAAFPNAANDDMVDGWSQGAIYLNERHGVAIAI